MIAGNPFKGGLVFSIGQYQHPDIMRFNIKSGALFAPPNPEKTYNYVKPERNDPTFGDVMQATFGSSVLNITNPQCRKMLENFKLCFENHRNKGDIQGSCAYYQQGLKRLSCEAN